MTSLGSHITVISGFSGDQRILFKTDNKLLQKQKVKQYPSCFPDSTSLADAFNNFFSSVKLTRYTMHLQRELLRMTSVHLILLTDLYTTDRPLCDVQIHNFEQVTLDMVKKFAVKTLT